MQSLQNHFVKAVAVDGVSDVHRKFSWGGGSISGIWWSFVFGVCCLWCHNL